MKKTFIVLFLVVALSVFSFGCASKVSTKIENTNSTYKVSYMDLTSEVNLTGTVSYLEEASVYSKVSGIVKKVYVTEGSLVRKGDKILEVDSTQAQFNYNSAKNSFENAKIAYETTLRSKTDLENAVKQQENNLKVAQASYDVAKANYDLVMSNPQATDIQKKTAEQQLIQAESTLSNAQIAYDSAKRNLDNFSLKLQSAKIQLDSAKLALDNALKTLSDYTITSPIDGVILSLQAKENAIVQPGIAVALIGNPKGYLITSYADEIDVPKLKVGQTAMVSFDAVSDLTLTGKISSISFTKVNIQGGNAYVVKVEVDKTDPRIRSGMSSNITITTGVKQHVLAVPISSITTLADGRTFVDKVSNNTITRTEIKTGIYGNAYVEVLSGLNEGDTILLVPQNNTTTSSSPFGG